MSCVPFHCIVKDFHVPTFYVLYHHYKLLCNLPLSVDGEPSASLQQRLERYFRLLNRCFAESTELCPVPPEYETLEGCEYIGAFLKTLDSDPETKRFVKALDLQDPDRINDIRQLFLELGLDDVVRHLFDTHDDDEVYGRLMELLHRARLQQRKTLEPQQVQPKRPTSFWKLLLLGLVFNVAGQVLLNSAVSLNNGSTSTRDVATHDVATRVREQVSTYRTKAFEELTSPSENVISLTTEWNFPRQTLRYHEDVSDLDEASVRRVLNQPVSIVNKECQLRTESEWERTCDVSSMLQLTTNVTPGWDTAEPLALSYLLSYVTQYRHTLEATPEGSLQMVVVPVERLPSKHLWQVSPELAETPLNEAMMSRWYDVLMETIALDMSKDTRIGTRHRIQNTWYLFSHLQRRGTVTVGALNDALQQLEEAVVNYAVLFPRDAYRSKEAIRAIPELNMKSFEERELSSVLEDVETFWRTHHLEGREPVGSGISESSFVYGAGRQRLFVEKKTSPETVKIELGVQELFRTLELERWGLRLPRVHFMERDGVWYIMTEYIHGTVLNDLEIQTKKRLIQQRNVMNFFDHLIGNMDRHGENVMLGDDGSLVLIDHDLSAFVNGLSKNDFEMSDGDQLILPESFITFIANLDMNQLRFPFSLETERITAAQMTAQLRSVFGKLCYHWARFLSSNDNDLARQSWRTPKFDASGIVVNVQDFQDELRESLEIHSWSEFGTELQTKLRKIEQSKKEKQFQMFQRDYLNHLQILVRGMSRSVRRSVMDVNALYDHLKTATELIFQLDPAFFVHWKDIKAFEDAQRTMKEHLDIALKTLSNAGFPLTTGLKTTDFKTTVVPNDQPNNVDMKAIVKPILKDMEQLERLILPEFFKKLY